MSEECPVCGDHHVHETRPPENKSSVSGMHVCYEVEDGELVMYIHEDSQSIHAPMDDEDASLEDALDGLITAVNYAESIGEPELAYGIAQQYQELGAADMDTLSIEESLELNPRGDEIDRYLDGESMESIIEDRDESGD